MLTEIHPKLPMRNKTITKHYYINTLGFKDIGTADFEGYLIMQKDNIQIHFLNLKILILQKIMDKFIFAQMILRNYINPSRKKRLHSP